MYKYRSVRAPSYRKRFRPSDDSSLAADSMWKLACKDQSRPWVTYPNVQTQQSWDFMDSWLIYIPGDLDISWISGCISTFCVDLLCLCVKPCLLLTPPLAHMQHTDRPHASSNESKYNWNQGLTGNEQPWIPLYARLALWVTSRRTGYMPAESCCGFSPRLRMHTWVRDQQGWGWRLCSREL